MTYIQKVDSFGGRVEELSPTRALAVFGLDILEDAADRAALSAMSVEQGRRALGGRAASARGQAGDPHRPLSRGPTWATVPSWTPRPRRGPGRRWRRLVAQAAPDSTS